MNIPEAATPNVVSLNDTWIHDVDEYTKFEANQYRLNEKHQYTIEAARVLMDHLGVSTPTFYPTYDQSRRNPISSLREVLTLPLDEDLQEVRASDHTYLGLVGLEDTSSGPVHSFVRLTETRIGPPKGWSRLRGKLQINPKLGIELGSPTSLNHLAIEHFVGDEDGDNLARIASPKVESILPTRSLGLLYAAGGKQITNFQQKLVVVANAAEFELP